MAVFTTFDQIIAQSTQLGTRRLALVQATSDLLLGALKQAMEAGLIEPVLIGPKEEITEKAKALGMDLHACTIIHHDGDEAQAVQRAVEVVKAGEAHLLMKGQVKTSTYLRGVLSGASGLKASEHVTHVAFAQSPYYHKVFAGTDGGVMRHPSFEEKVTITRNAVRLLRLLGYERPKVGCLAYSEVAREDDPETWDAKRLADMGQNGEFGLLDMAGPLGYDMMFDKESAAIKGFEHPVAGDVDVYIAPDITACNASTKAVYLNGGQAAGVLVGTNVPVLMLSRADSEKTRLNTMALGVMMSHGIEKAGGF